MLYNIINGGAHNNSTTNLPHRNASAQHLDMSRCWDVANFCPLVVSVAGVRVVEFGSYAASNKQLVINAVAGV